MNRRNERKGRTRDLCIVIGFTHTCCARNETARYGTRWTKGRRSIGAVVELTTDAKFITVYRIAWSRSRKRWIKISKSLKLARGKFGFTLRYLAEGQFWNQFNDTNKKYCSFKTETFPGELFVEQFFFLKVSLLWVYNRNEISDK